MKRGALMRKRIAIFLLLLFAAGVFYLHSNREIGTVSGIENECITIDNVVYERDNMSGLSRNDKGTYLGKVKNADITMRVYSVKGDTNHEYIYALWEWEGGFYSRTE